MIGLKSFNEKVKGAKLSYKIKELKYELKWAWQRAWREYDDIMCFSLDYHFIKTYRILLKELRANLHGYPHEMTMEEWENILDVMIGLLEIMDEDIDTGEDDLLKECERIEDAKNEFFKLFSKHFYKL